eukprot:2201407-Rhodomonas_salina.1
MIETDLFLGVARPGGCGPRMGTGLLGQLRAHPRAVIQGQCFSPPTGRERTGAGSGTRCHHHVRLSEERTGPPDQSLRVTITNVTDETFKKTHKVRNHHQNHDVTVTLKESI